jgi:hypothetical protein
LKEETMSKIVLSSALAAVVIAGLSTAQPAIAVNSGEQAALLCRYEGYESKWFFFSDIIMMPKAVTGYDGNGRPLDDRNVTVFLPEFDEHMNKKGHTVYQSDSYCGFWETANEAEAWKQSEITNKGKYGYSFNPVTDWRPSNVPVSAAPSKQPEKSAKPGKNESIIVRDVGQPAAAKPAGEGAAKPVAAAKPAPKPAAKPAPKKPTKPCGRKGQRKCDRPSA